ncbi:uncharacterized protein EDB91DRAFT_1257606 [Suillus paluster]|uniref:uncharacterized protein n=1 Tax=Suillus paluster TaxID=48578 RepID=UPI001B87E209|nr:uncharacterized protein EDB91DRAFT_1257606 [Suillus paluster]KAG1719495.1 hypothetical protein EDB91DRAFT_1257606 [Suillus paluster]
MFKKSALLILVTAAFAVALPTPALLGGVGNTGNSNIGSGDIPIPSDLIGGVANTGDSNIGSGNIPIPSDLIGGVANTGDSNIGSGDIPIPSGLIRGGANAGNNNNGGGDIIDGSNDYSTPAVRSTIPVAPQGFSQAEGKVKTPNTFTPKLPSGVKSFPRTPRAQPKSPVPRHADPSQMQSRVEGVVKALGANGLKLRSSATSVVIPTDPENASSSNVKPPSLARRAESCSSDYTLAYCRRVLKAGDDFIPTLLAMMKEDTSVTGPVGLSCGSAAKTSEYSYPLCYKKMGNGVALDCQEATINSLN